MRRSALHLGLLSLLATGCGVAPDADAPAWNPELDPSSDPSLDSAVAAPRATSDLDPLVGPDDIDIEALSPDEAALLRGWHGLPRKVWLAWLLHLRRLDPCNGRDDNGDGIIDNGWPDTDHDGVRDCVDTETCDGVDNDGDRQIDEGFDADGDGTADCFDTEACDGLDNDGDGAVDEGFDADGDGAADCLDACATDPGKTDPGTCGCGTPDADTDGDGAADCLDACPEDAGKTDPGTCGCGVSDADTDGDGALDCLDACAADPGKTDPGTCGCGTPDADTDGDGALDCLDACAADPGKTDPGTCGCGVSDADTDGDGALDCLDACAADPGKTDPGTCGCGVSDADTDGDGALDCLDACAADPGKTDPGTCGCGTPDADTDGDGAADCLDACPSDPANDADGDGVCGDADNCPDVANPPTSERELPPNCDGGTFEGHDYAICTGSKTLPEAVADCASMDMELAFVDTQAENTWLVDRALAANGCTNFYETSYWVANVKSETSTHWPSGDPVWAAGEPNGDGNNIHLVRYCNDPDGWNDAPPTYRWGWVCEAPAAPPGQSDTDGDGLGDACDDCPADADKSAPGACGCGVADTDTDGDGAADCVDTCAADPGKTDPGACGCGTADTDSDADGAADCLDACATDPAKTDPGVCGCGTADTDTDGDGAADCLDACAADPAKTEPGTCGCGVSDADTDGDGALDCLDVCPEDAAKTEPGTCGCGVADADTDGDGALDCLDACATDPAKTAPGTCGCGVSDADTDGDALADCLDTETCDGLDNDGDGATDEGFDADGDGAADCLETCTTSITWCSGDDLDGGPYAPGELQPTYDLNPRWTARIPGAVWVWDNYLEPRPVTGRVLRFDRDLTLPADATLGAATLSIAADNAYLVDVNGARVAGDGTETNYFAPADVWDLSGDLLPGDNLFSVTVDNFPQANATAFSNPGGVLYCLTVTYDVDWDPEVCNGLDDDCDGEVDEGLTCTSDDDDTVVVVDPRTPPEVCNGRDDDEDGVIDDGLPDSDGDGVCDARDTEQCDGLDNDGDGAIDEGFDADADGTGDCLDTEDCDGLDNDGDGAVDEGFDADADGTADCFDAEDCDGLDNDGDGASDEDLPDSDADGICDARDVERCDALDNDGDGGVDEDGVCPAADGLCPDPRCLSLADATALGWLAITSGATAAEVTFHNTGSRDICLDEQAMFTSVGTQAMFIDAAVVGTRLAPGTSATLYYGSWTTPNGVYAPYLGLPAWWCVESGQPAAPNATYDLLGELAPPDLAALVAPGLGSRNVWAGDYGVLANYDLWGRQASKALFSVGKTAQDAGGQVEVLLAVRNIGAWSGEAVVVDLVPAGWTVHPLSPELSVSVRPDGQSEVHAPVSLPGTVGAYTPAASWLRYTITADDGADRGRVDLPRATVSWTDGAVSHSATSLGATAFTVDVDGDGFPSCP